MGKENKKTLSEILVLSEEWSDKKRILGAPISFTHYSMTDGRLLIRRGLLSTHYDETMLFRIYDIQMVQTFWQKLFGVGTITIFTCDASASQKKIRLVNIKKPLEVRDLLSRRVETARDEKGIQGAEFIGAFGIHG